MLRILIINKDKNKKDIKNNKYIYNYIKINLYFY